MHIDQLLLSLPFQIAYILSFILAGAVWRRWNGSNHENKWSQHRILRVAIGLPIAIGAAWVGSGFLTGFNLALPVIMAGFAMWALLQGYLGEDWGEWWPQVITYWPASVGAGAWGVWSGNHVAAGIYIAFLLVAGAAHPFGNYILEYWWPENRKPFKYTEWAECAAGGIVIGGMAGLSLG